jgi:hypothetical protein
MLSGDLEAVDSAQGYQAVIPGKVNGEIDGVEDMSVGGRKISAIDPDQEVVPAEKRQKLTLSLSKASVAKVLNARAEMKETALTAADALESTASKDLESDDRTESSLEVVDTQEHAEKKGPRAPSMRDILIQVQNKERKLLESQEKEVEMQIAQLIRECAAKGEPWTAADEKQWNSYHARRSKKAQAATSGAKAVSTPLQRPEISGWSWPKGVTPQQQLTLTHPDYCGLFLTLVECDAIFHDLWKCRLSESDDMSLLSLDAAWSSREVESYLPELLATWLSELQRQEPLVPSSLFPTALPIDCYTMSEVMRLYTTADQQMELSWEEQDREDDNDNDKDNDNDNDNKNDNDSNHSQTTFPLFSPPKTWATSSLTERRALLQGFVTRLVSSPAGEKCIAKVLEAQEAIRKEGREARRVLMQQVKELHDSISAADKKLQALRSQEKEMEKTKDKEAEKAVENAAKLVSLREERQEVEESKKEAAAKKMALRTEISEGETATLLECTTVGLGLRAHSLGQDRWGNRYWEFFGVGGVWIESPPPQPPGQASSAWAVVKNVGELKALQESLDSHLMGESELKAELLLHAERIGLRMQSETLWHVPLTLTVGESQNESQNEKEKPTSARGMSMESDTNCSQQELEVCRSRWLWTEERAFLGLLCNYPEEPEAAKAELVPVVKEEDQTIDTTATATETVQSGPSSPNDLRHQAWIQRMKVATSAAEIGECVQEFLLSLNDTVLRYPFGSAAPLRGRRSPHYEAYGQWQKEGADPNALFSLLKFSEGPKSLSAWILIHEIIQDHTNWEMSLLEKKCSVCRKKSQADKMLLCDKCDDGYHMHCLRPKLSEAPEGTWLCPQCQEEEVTAQNADHCATCKEGGDLLCCDGCPKSYHLACLRGPKPRLSASKAWFCPSCIKKNAGEEEEEEEEEESSAMNSDASTEESGAESDANDDFCWKCKKSGDLLCCDTCPKSYHLACLGIKRIPRGEYSCPRCHSKKHQAVLSDSESSGADSEEDVSQLSDEEEEEGMSSGSEVEHSNVCGFCGGVGELLCCDGCPSAYHLDCLVPPLHRVPRTDWYCRSCTVSRLNDVEESDDNGAVNEDLCAVCSKAGNLLCCDYCPRSLHFRCCEPKIASMPRGKYKCHFCRDGIPFRSARTFQSSTRSDASSRDWKKAENLLQSLMNHDDAWPFLGPVDKRDAPDYYRIIKHPIDLGEIRTKLHDRMYENVEFFLGDLELLFENSALYNKDGSEVGKSGAGLLKYCRKRVRQEFPASDAFL